MMRSGEAWSNILEISSRLREVELGFVGRYDLPETLQPGKQRPADLTTRAGEKNSHGDGLKRLGTSQNYHCSESGNSKETRTAGHPPLARICYSFANEAEKTCVRCTFSAIGHFGVV